jgi:hypothetical protein
MGAIAGFMSTPEILEKGKKNACEKSVKIIKIICDRTYLTLHSVVYIFYHVKDDRIRPSFFTPISPWR